jgi:HSP20 family protein
LEIGGGVLERPKNRIQRKEGEKDIMAEKSVKEKSKLHPLRTRSPFEEMERLWVDEFLREPLPWLVSSGWPRFISPDLPGIRKEEIDTTIAGHIVTLSGEKKQDEEVEKKNYYRKERSYGSFTRSFHLPVEVQADKAKAKFENGVLEIRIPKTEEAKKKEKKIPIE